MLPVRRETLRALVATVCMLAAGSFAQDPKSILAQKAAREWLAKTDKVDAAASYDAAGAKFKEAVTVDRWMEALQKARGPLGALDQRSIFQTTFDKKLPDGGPEGEYVLVMYRTAFAKKADSVETVTLEREKDGVWRVIGYFVR
jgi:Protein of unknown function (DUF4019)